MVDVEKVGAAGRVAERSLEDPIGWQVADENRTGNGDAAEVEVAETGDDEGTSLVQTQIYTHKWKWKTKSKEFDVQNGTLFQDGESNIYCKTSENMFPLLDLTWLKLSFVAFSPSNFKYQANISAVLWYQNVTRPSSPSRTVPFAVTIWLFYMKNIFLCDFNLHSRTPSSTLLNLQF